MVVLRRILMKLKTPNVFRVILAFFIIGMLHAAGCNRQQSNNGGKQKTNQEMTILQSKANICLPDDTVIIASSDGGGRDAPGDYHLWVLHSQSKITMPIMHAPGVKDYLTMPLDDTVKFVEVEMRPRKIISPKLALSSDWMNNDYRFEGTLVRSSEGDYLVIEQSKKIQSSPTNNQVPQ
jgi:hypothetical protein